MDLLELAPVVDGDFIADDPSWLFHNAGQLDYMAGVNSMDGHIFAGVDVPSINKRNVQKHGEDTGVLRWASLFPDVLTAGVCVLSEQVKGFLTRLTNEKGTTAVDSAFNVYSAHWGSYPDPAVVKKTVADIETDFLFLVPTQIALQLHANNTSGARTFSYLFNMKTRIPGFPSWVEAEHAEDLQYLFGKPFSTPLVYFPRHRDLAGYMMAYWTNFARTGNPNSGESKVPVPWPEFTKYHRPYLTINSKMAMSSVRYWVLLRFYCGSNEVRL
ncbi:bile salt-activated lipase-like [Acanthochromis polyacanthus]|uniref:bile salt-activated lipase-like n=1 Tax=Acanthochromis polyacanthus TaxID=80966 RepID=UPI002234336A|nr:bile salt-activated lipase-like [Acanthochromis polyacanthus]